MMSRGVACVVLIVLAVMSAGVPRVAAAQPLKLSTNPRGDSYRGADAPAFAESHRRGQRLVVWSGDEDAGRRIYARILDDAGQSAGPILPISQPASNSSYLEAPSATYNARTDEYLVVWVRREVTGRLRRTSEVLAQRLSSMGIEVGRDDFPVAAPEESAPRDRSLSAPAAGWNTRANRYLVVWLGRSTKSGRVLFPLARSFSAAGRPLSRARRLSSHAALYPSAPALAYVTSLGRHVIAWNGARRRARLKHQPVVLWTARVDASGRRRGMGSAIAKIAPRAALAQPPRLVAHGETNTELLVVWKGQAQRRQHAAVFDRLLNASGKPEGPQRRISATRDIDNYVLSSPALAFNPMTRTHLAAWRFSALSTGIPPSSGCSTGPEVQLQALSLSGREIGPDDATATVDDVPPDPAGAPANAGPCKAVVIGSLDLAPARQRGYLFAWSGAVLGSREQIWVRGLP